MQMRPAARLALSGLVMATLVACGAPAPAPQDKQEAEALGRDTDETVFILETWPGILGNTSNTIQKIGWRNFRPGATIIYTLEYSPAYAACKNNLIARSIIPNIIYQPPNASTQIGRSRECIGVCQ